MPLLDIGVAHSSFQNYLGYSKLQYFFNGQVPSYALLQDEERWSSFRKVFQNSGKLNLSVGFLKRSHPKFYAKVVATLEPTHAVQNSNDGEEKNELSSVAKSELASAQADSSSSNTEVVDEREKLRRQRISKANKGNIPWNKGRKHSPETLQRIKERTRLAMQNPKVKMKLANIGHSQSTETRKKIGDGVRIGWQKRRKKLMVQENCLFDWKNLIADAARKGLHGEEELEWDSYEILNEQLRQEWLNSIEYRKMTPRPKGGKRAPKSPEQRRKISEAIAAKWADPEYRSRVCSALAKYHGIREGAERKVRKKPSGEGRSTKTSAKRLGDGERSGARATKLRTQPIKLKNRNAPKYKDPLANSKLEMLKSIRAQRAASETKKNEALERAKLLIAEAQKAANSLEVAAMRSPVARASLIEAKKLIAEATQSIDAIEKGEFTSQDDVAAVHQNFVQQGTESLKEDTIQGYNKGRYGIGEMLAEDGDRGYHKRVNGTGESLIEDTVPSYYKGVNGINSLLSSEGQKLDTDLYESTMLDEMDKNYQLLENLGGYEFTKLNLESLIGNSNLELHKNVQGPEPNGPKSVNGISASPNGVNLLSHEEHSSAEKPVTKRWVCGRLIEVVDDE